MVVSTIDGAIYPGMSGGPPRLRGLSDDCDVIQLRLHAQAFVVRERGFRACLRGLAGQCRMSDRAGQAVNREAYI